MKQLGYGKYIEQTLNKVPYGTIILPKTIAKAMAKKFAMPLNKAITLCNLKVKRLTDKDTLVRLRKGIYCRCVQTVFGNAEPAEEQVAAQILIFRKVGLSVM